MHSLSPFARRVFAALGAVAALGCGFADIFASAGLEPVQMVFQGDSVLSRDSTAPFSIVVVASGTPLERPRLQIASGDTTVFTLTASGDSIHAGTRIAKADLTVRLLSSILADSGLVLRQTIRVKP